MPLRGIVAASRFFSVTRAREDFTCSNFTSTERRTPPRSRCFWKKPAWPIEPVPVDTRKGDQFKPEFLKVNPNGKVPAIDDDGVFVFDCNAILLYLAEKTGKFLPPNTPANRARIAVVADVHRHRRRPVRGQAVHFKHFAPKEGGLRAQPLSVRGAAPLHASSTIISPTAATWSATPTPSSTWRCGAGRGWPVRPRRRRLCEISPT